MSEWFETLDGLHGHVWHTLTTRRDGPRLVALANQGPDGWPEARTVVLRDADRAEATVAIHTDRYSDKIVGLRDIPRATVLLWDETDRLQIRLRIEVFIQTGLAVEEHWRNVPDPSREAYGTTPPPGTPIPSALDYEKPADRAAFAVLHGRVMQIDAVHLGDQHRRAAYSRDDDWAGQWLAP